MTVNIINKHTNQVIISAESFEGFNFAAAQEEGVDFSRANFSNINCSGANFDGVSLANSILTNANMSFASFNSANLCRAILLNVNFYDSDLSNANLSKTNANVADFCRANLTNVNLTESDLFGALFCQAAMHRTLLIGALRMLDAHVCCADLSGAIIADGWVCTGKWHSVNNVGTGGASVGLYECDNGEWCITTDHYGWERYPHSADQFLRHVEINDNDAARAAKLRALINALCV